MQHKDETDNPFMGPVRHPISDSLDLHTFQPKEVRNLLQDYLNECVRSGLHEVRIIHGKGTGRLRQVVHKALKASPLVRSFQLAPPEAGSWGATIVKLR